eukprot:759976-Hanusia_phi.AAC.1
MIVLLTRSLSGTGGGDGEGNVDEENCGRQEGVRGFDTTKLGVETPRKVCERSLRRTYTPGTICDEELIGCHEEGIKGEGERRGREERERGEEGGRGREERQGGEGERRGRQEEARVGRWFKSCHRLLSRSLGDKSLQTLRRCCPLSPALLAHPLLTLPLPPQSRPLVSIFLPEEAKTSDDPALQLGFCLVDCTTGR